MKKLYTLSLSLLSCFGAFSQAPVITAITGPTSACSVPAPPSSFTVSATNSPTGYSWYVLPGAGVVITNGNTANPTISFPNTNSIYNVYCVASNASGPSSPGSFAVTVYETPTVTFSGNTNLFCQGSSTSLMASPTIISASSTLSYSWTPSTGLNTTTGNAVVASPLSTTTYTVLLSLGTCYNTAQVTVSVNSALNISISPSAPTVCLGSSATLYASGASSYTWTGGTNGSSLNVMAGSSGVFFVNGKTANGCTGTGSVLVTVNPNCSDVWPGDANSDGVVNTLDVFELGYAFSNTGPARPGGNNSYIAQAASNWSGLISTGKNKCHADCNGDGAVNLADTFAIAVNYSQTHNFRSSSSASGPLTLISHNENQIAPGQWNLLEVVVADNADVTASGFAFDIHFDKNVIDEVSFGYTASFINQNNTNVEFARRALSSGVINAATVRTDGADATGQGAIASLWIKPKEGIAENTTTSVQLTNVVKTIANHDQESLSNQTIELTFNNNPTGIRHHESGSSFAFFPNPATNQITLKSNPDVETSFNISDISGRSLRQGTFTSITVLDVSGLADGTYLIRLSNDKATESRRVVITR